MPMTKYVWDVVHDSYLMEKDETGSTTAVYTNEPEQFGSLISQRRGVTTSYYHFDGLGSTRELTDSTASVTDEYVNDAWGVTIVESGTTTNPFRYHGYVGYYIDEETKEIYIRQRMYTPILARFSARDPLGWIRVENLYAYVNNNSVNDTDPTGFVTMSMHKGRCGPRAPCGSALFDVQFDAKKGEFGYVIQLVFRFTYVTDCDEPPNIIKQKRWFYYEIWKVEDGKFFAGADLAKPVDLDGLTSRLGDRFTVPDRGLGTQGNQQVYGYSLFVKNYEPDFEEVWNNPPHGNASAGSQPVADNLPRIHLGQFLFGGGLAHSLEATWNCCSDCIRPIILPTKVSCWPKAKPEEVPVFVVPDV